MAKKKKKKKKKTESIQKTPISVDQGGSDELSLHSVLHKNYNS